MEEHHRGTEGGREARLNRPVLLEVCIDSVEGCLAAQAGGAGRVELCSDLMAGGTTPSAGMIRVVRSRLSLPLHVMVRPRGGDFCHSDAEFEVMRLDIELAKACGADGVVLGLLLEDGSVDVARTAPLVALARPLSVTFHRAFDLTRDPFAALEDLIRLGIDRVLTSGQEASAQEGAGLIADLVRRADGRILIVPGGGVNEQNIREIVVRTGVREVHASCSVPLENRIHRHARVSLDGAPSGLPRRMTDESRVRAFAQALKVSPAP